MKYWDVLEGRGFLPSADPPVSLFLGEAFVFTAHHLETVRSSDVVSKVLECADVAGVIEEADEQNLYRLLVLFEYFETLSPNCCQEFREQAYVKAGHVPDVYYVRCLNNWRRARADRIIHHDNLQQLNAFGGEELLKLHVDMESRAVDAVRCIATVFATVTPDKFIRTLKNTVTAMSGLNFQPISNDGTFGRCFGLLALGRLFNHIPEPIPTVGMCEEHAKLFRRLESVRQPFRDAMTGELSVVYEQTAAACRELMRKYSLLLNTYIG